MLKGTVAVVIAGYFGGPNAAMLAALGAFLGHLFPVWLKFKGGKGVAVYIGVLIGLFWPAAIVFCVVWAATAATSRYSSLSALVASFVTPIFLWWFGHSAPFTRHSGAREARTSDAQLRIGESRANNF